MMAIRTPTPHARSGVQPLADQGRFAKAGRGRDQGQLTLQALIQSLQQLRAGDDARGRAGGTMQLRIPMKSSTDSGDAVHSSERSDDGMIIVYQVVDMAKAASTLRRDSPLRVSRYAL
jgi:hypothetical protein